MEIRNTFKIDGCGRRAMKEELSSYNASFGYGFDPDCGSYDGNGSGHQRSSFPGDSFSRGSGYGYGDDGLSNGDGYGTGSYDPSEA